MTISRSIVEAVRNLGPPGRFLEKDVNTGVWSDIGDKKAVEKTSQALRDGAASLRKLLSDDLNDPDVIGAFCEDPKNMEAKLAAKRKALKEKALRAAEAVNSPKQETTPGALMMNTKSPSPGMHDAHHHMHAPVVSPSGSEMSPSQHYPHHHNPHAHMQPGHHAPPRHEYDAHYRYPQDHDQHRNYDYQGHPPPHHYNQSAAPPPPHNYPYQGYNEQHRRGHESPPRRRMDRYQEMDISPPPSPRIEHSRPRHQQQGDHHNRHNNYWSGMSMNKDSTSSLFRELKHHASNSMIRNDNKPSYNRHARGSYSSHDMNRFPSPPQNRNTPTNFVEVTQEGFYQCSSSRGTVTGRFRDSNNDPYNYQGSSPYETRTPNGGYNGHHDEYDNGLITPSPTRSKLMNSGDGYHDTKKYFEPPPPQRSKHNHHSYHRSSHRHHSSHQYHHDDYNNRRGHDEYNRNYQNQYYSPHQYPVPPPPQSEPYDQQQPSPHQTYSKSNQNNPAITPSPKNRNVVYHQHHTSSTTTSSTPQAPPTPPNRDIFKDPFDTLPPTPPSNKDFDNANDSDAWLTDSPIFLPMEDDPQPSPKLDKKPGDLEKRTHSDTSRHSTKSSTSYNSNVTPLPFRSSPDNSFSPFLGYLCCGPSFCEQQTTNDISIQPWCGPGREMGGRRSTTPESKEERKSGDPQSVPSLSTKEATV